MADVVIVNVNGTDYYVSSDNVDYLTEIDGYLVNTSNSTIYLYKTIRINGDSSSGYPRITCPSMTRCYLQSSQQAMAQTISVSSYSVKSRKFTDSYLLSVLIFGVLVLMLFKKR